MENLEVGVEAVLRLVSIHDLEEAYFTIAFLSVLGAPHHLAIHVMRGSTTVDLIPVNANQPVQVQKGEQRNIEMDLNRIEFASCHDRVSHWISATSLPPQKLSWFVVLHHAAKAVKRCCLIHEHHGYLFLWMGKANAAEPAEPRPKKWRADIAA
ncbi:hypothetical protein Y032_0088g2135 [Ancylostoma ceylanicum]|uniref:Uncharacterized protein n=1 Tax=Ancylostoma ceylanicum TaxID=53326 RepID=A0A016TNK6_9BILA|nr:hypothetical protein Y032_0088g2135 [Ancylostoma ceylanicum]